jgi:ribosomal protein S12 methylthiotransferase accessory factor YcaO
VSTKWKQTVATQDRDYSTENKETEETTRENQTTWDKTLERLKEALPLEEAQARLTGTTLIQVTDTGAQILVPSANALLWLERRMYRQISNAMKGVLGKDLDLQFVAAS